MYAAILQQQAYELASQLLAAASGDRMGGSGTVGGGSGGGSRALEASLSGLSLSSAASFGRSLSSPDKEQGAVSADPSSSAAGSSGSMAAAGSEAADHAQVATLYRRAAGIFKHIAEVLYPAAVAAPGFPTGERPVEVWEGAGEAMQALCLAQVGEGTGQVGIPGRPRVIFFSRGICSLDALALHGAGARAVRDGSTLCMLPCRRKAWRRTGQRCGEPAPAWWQPCSAVQQVTSTGSLLTCQPTPPHTALSKC